MAGSEGGCQIVSDAVELERLRRQGELLAPATRVLLEAAGIRPGMRVLDLGSGAGDVAFLAAGLVGPSGEVVGVERSPESVATARARTGQLGLGNVSFVVGDVHEPAPGGPFDAIVCRLVLMYLPNPAAVLRTQVAGLRPGGVVAPIEADLLTTGSQPPTPLTRQLMAWVLETFERSGFTTSLGTRLWTVLEEAGIQPRGMLGVQPYFGPRDADGPLLLAGIVRALVPLIERAGVATAEEVGPATLQRRLEEELASNGAVFAHPILLSAWGSPA
jgi:ubiquinone/menaquinone biosynthesis C-methylase UbiE